MLLYLYVSSYIMLYLHLICYRHDLPLPGAGLAVTLVDAGLASEAHLVVALRLQTRLLRFKEKHRVL